MWDGTYRSDKTAADYATLRVSLRNAILRVHRWDKRVFDQQYQPAPADVSEVFRAIESGAMHVGEATEALTAMIGNLMIDAYREGVEDGN
jgi:hypothetical protein